MPSCRLPDGSVIGVASCQECDRMYNGACLGDSPYPEIRINLPCFVRNVLVRALADALLDVGSAEGVSAAMVEALSPGAELKPAEGGAPLRLTPELRQDLAQRISEGVLRLATTYQTTLDFRDHVLLPTPRGRQLKDHYDRQLPRIYHVATLDLGLVHEAAATWLAIHPFVAAVVNVATRRAGSDDRDMRLSAEQWERCRNLFGRFRDGSRDPSFREVLERIEREWREYEGLSAEQALEKLRAAPAVDE